MMRELAAIIALTGTYALTLGSVNMWDLGAGAMLSALLLRTFREFVFPRPAIPAGVALRRAWGVPALIGRTLANITADTIAVAKVVLSPSGPRAAGFVEIPRGERTDAGLSVSALLDTMSPGSVFIETDPHERAWTIHALDASDPEKVREEAERFYQRFQRPVIP